MLILSIFAFIVILSFVFISHEYGHFVAAKIAKVPVLRFGIGFFKPIFKWKKKETQYSINVLPFGAFVDVLGLDTPKDENKNSYWKQSVFKRFLIASFGVLFNFIFAWILLTISLWIFAIFPPKSFVMIQDVKKGSPAEITGLKQGDIIVSANGEVFKTAEQISQFTQSHKNQEINLKIKRSGKETDKQIKLSEDVEAPLGVSMADAGVEEKVAFYKAPLIALEVLGAAVYATFAYLGRAVASVFTHVKVPLEVSGPVGVYGIVSQFTSLGFVYLLRISAFLSLGVGIFNLLPIPALDGARIIFLILEKIFGKKVIKPETENTIHSVGFMFLIAIMILITYNDITRLLGK